MFPARAAARRQLQLERPAIKRRDQQKVCDAQQDNREQPAHGLIVSAPSSDCHELRKKTFVNQISHLAPPFSIQQHVRR